MYEYVCNMVGRLPQQHPVRVTEFFSTVLFHRPDKNITQMYRSLLSVKTIFECRAVLVGQHCDESRDCFTIFRSTRT